MTESGHDEPEGGLPETSRERAGSSSGAAPRMARYGEGAEGRPARRERDIDGPRDTFFGRVGKFVRDTRAELGRTTWPTALQIRNTTIITVVAVVFFAIYLFVVDQALSKGIEGLHWLINRIFGGA